LSCRFFSCPQFLEKKTNRRRRHSGQFICAHSWSSVLLTGVLGIVFETKLSPMPFHAPDFPWSILWKYYLMPPLEGYNALAFFGYYISYHISCYKGFPEQYPQQATPQRRLSILPICTELPLGLKLLKGGECTKRTQDLAVTLMIMGRLLANFVSSLASNNAMCG
jgi:hypothetical protein